MTKAERTEKARAEHECPRPRCGALPGKPCRAHVPQYTPLGFDNPIYGRPMTQVHPERLALVEEES